MPTKVATAQITITDQNDYIYQGTTPPPNPIVGVTLWIDTSLTPSQQKRWTGSKWEVVNEVVVGGRNILRNSGDFKGTQFWIDSTPLVVYYDNKKCLKLSTDNESGFVDIKQNFTIEANKQYCITFSFDQSKSYCFQFDLVCGTPITGYTQTEAVYGKLKKVSITFTNLNETSAWLWFVCFGKGVGSAIYVSDIKLELGNKPTDWSPAPEDVAADIAAAAAAAAQAKAQSDAQAFLAEAMGQDTQIDGGLALLTALFTRYNNIVTAGILAKTPTNDVAVFGGGTYEEALLKQSAFGFTHSGDAWMKGVIEALSGKIGLFDILAGNIVGRDVDGIEKVRFGVENVPDVASLSGNNVVIATMNQASKGGGAYYNTSTRDTDMSNNVFNLSFNFYIPYATTASMTIPSVSIDWFGHQVVDSENYSFGITILKPNGTTLVASYNGGSFTCNDIGTYTVNIQSSYICELNPATTGWQSFDQIVSSCSVTMIESVQKTAIGKNGFYSYFSLLEHIFFKSGVGFIGRGKFDIPAGLGGANVGSSGTHSNKWGLVSSSVRNTTTTTIYHNVTDTKITLNLTPRSSFTWYVSTITAATSPTANNGTIVVVCTQNTAVFDFVIVRTPY